MSRTWYVRLLLLGFVQAVFTLISRIEKICMIYCWPEEIYSSYEYMSASLSSISYVSKLHLDIKSSRRLLRKTTYIFQTANPGESTMASSKTVFPNDFDDERQPEMAIWLHKPEIVLSPTYDRYRRNSTANLEFSRPRRTRRFRRCL